MKICSLNPICKNKLDKFIKLDLTLNIPQSIKKSLCSLQTSRIITMTIRFERLNMTAEDLARDLQIKTL